MIFEPLLHGCGFLPVQDDNQQPRMLIEIDNVIGMIESMLSFARDDARHEPRTLVDVSALTEDICLDAVDAGEPVTYSGPRGITIPCRTTALRRAISNLIDNAVKYGNRVYVSLVPGPECVVLTVEDDGPGIPRSERERVFDPFYRIEYSRDPNTGGVGLGLSVTHSIIWEHGGDIILGTRKGGGLSVSVEWYRAVRTRRTSHRRKKRRHQHLWIHASNPTAKLMTSVDESQTSPTHQKIQQIKLYGMPWKPFRTDHLTSSATRFARGRWFVAAVTMVFHCALQG